MNLPDHNVLWFAGILGGANLVVSFLVVRSEFYSSFQKFAQCLIVWLMPILGAVGVWGFLRVPYKWKMYDTRAYPAPAEEMVAVEIDSFIHDSSGDAGGNGGSD